MSLLAIHYLCDVASTAEMLNRSQMLDCMENYQAVKNHFVDLTDTRPTGVRNAAAYTAFKSWEAQNHALVAQLRQDALQELNSSR